MVARVVNPGGPADGAPNAADRADARCPGAVHAIAARDGLLVRVRVPGGLLGAPALAALASAAERYADGNLDLTARASVQLRGVRPDHLMALGDALVSAGLLPSIAHDRVRNIVASPFAGVDRAECIDPRPVVYALSVGLVADPVLAALPAKFAFVVDGGGRPFPSSRPDIALRALATPNGPRFHVVLGGAATGHIFLPGTAPAVALSVARASLAAATATGETETWRLGSASPSVRAAARAALHRFPSSTATVGGEAIAAIEERKYANGAIHDGTYAAHAIRGKYAPEQTSARGFVVPLGLLATRDPLQLTVVPSVPLGRLTAPQARGAAALAGSVGADVRLGWWRGFVLANVPHATAATVVAELARLGLPCDRRDGFVGLAACAGRAGCGAALADVRSDAVEFARSIARRRTGGWSANFAGCSKRCAMRRGASVDLVATKRGYDVLLYGSIVRRHASADDALAFALRCAEDAARAHDERRARAGELAGDPAALSSDLFV